MSDVTKLQVRWDGSHEPFAVVEVVKGESLASLYSKLVRLLPAMRKMSFSFSHKGVPIRSELWELIEARTLEPVLVVKEGFYDFIRRLNVGSIAIALYDFHMEPREEAREFVTLSFRQGDTIVVMKREPDSAWWYGSVLDRMQYGWFPSNRIQVVKSPQEADSASEDKMGRHDAKEL